MPVWVGTSGWQYRDWRGRFYPERLPQRLWLEHYAAHFATVEVNNTFYRLPAPEVFARWAERLPEGFVMTLKVSRYVTHIKQLRDPAASVTRFLEHSASLGRFTGPLLVQLPPTLQADVPRLVDALAAFPPHLRVAFEPRHESWWTDDVAAALHARNAALVLADRKSKPLGPIWRTADWGYVRFHEGAARPWPHYGDSALHTWAERIASCWDGDADVFAYFNNDPGCWAVADAVTFARAVAATGRTATVTPDREEVTPRAA
ncbi:MAG TPA: DUF72 domain-containing protein [Acidimicrobiales bacterium]|nr:DUF72 domain-containing protein [Acidimicrobiales bacterium]